MRINPETIVCLLVSFALLGTFALLMFFFIRMQTGGL